MQSSLYNAYDLAFVMAVYEQFAMSNKFQD